MRRTGNRSGVAAIRGFPLPALAVAVIVVGSLLLAAPAPAAPTHIQLELLPRIVAANGAAKTTAKVTLTDDTGSGVSGQAVFVTVQSNDSGEIIGPTIEDLGDGTYATTITSSTTPGAKTITANDTLAGLTVAATLTQHGPAAVVSVNPVSPVVADGISTTPVTAHVMDSGGNPVSHDTVVFSPQPQFGAVADNRDGSYTATYTSTTAVGTFPVSVTDGLARPGETAVTQTPVGSVTSLSALPATAVTNQGVALIASITPTSGSVAPSGTVTFANDGIPIPGCSNQPVSAQPARPLSLSGCQTAFPARSWPEQLTASFSSKSPNITDSIGATAVTVDRASTSTSFDVSNPTVRVGSTATYEATVTPADYGSFTPTGSVAFTDAGAPIAGCGARPVVGGVATCTVRYPRPGSHSITARYASDSNFKPSTSPTQAVTVHALPPRVLGTIKATMQWLFFFTPSYTEIREFVINGAPVGSTVALTCKGRGCPFANRIDSVRIVKSCHSTRRRKCHAHRAGTVDFVGSFRHRQLSVATRIVIRIARPQWIGKYYLFKIRKSRPPAIHIDCLAPGATKPGVGC